MSLHDVRFKATAKTNTVLEAAKIIGVTDRTRRRSREHFDTSGYKRPVDQRKAKPSEGAVDLFQRAIALGLDAFTFGLKAQTRNMDQAATLRVNGAVACRNPRLQTIESDLGSPRGQMIGLIVPQAAGLVELELHVTSPVRCLSMTEQMAQKLQACTSPSAARRDRDVLDILLVEMLQDLDYLRAADAAQPVFAACATLAFPSELNMPAEW